MTTRTAGTKTHTVKTLNARRKHGEALIQAADAEQAQQLAAAEAQAAEQEVARRQSQARHAELSAQLDALDAFAKEQERRADEQAYAEVVRRQETMERARAFINEPPPRVHRSFAEHQAELRQLDNYVDRMVQAEQEELRRHTDRCESRRLVDPAYRRRYDFHHPGGADRCDCPAHRAWRREE